MEDIHIFFKRWPSLGEHLFEHLLWSIFQSSIHKHYKLHFFMIKNFCGQLFMYCINTFLSDLWVSSTFGVLFDRFPTVKCFNKGCSFLLWRDSCSKKFQSRLSSGGGIFSLHSFAKITWVLETTAQCVRDKMYQEWWKESIFSLSFLSYTINDIRRKLHKIGI